MTRRQAGREYGVLMFVVFSVLSDSVLVFGDGRRAGREFGVLVFPGFSASLDSVLVLEMGDGLAGSMAPWCLWVTMCYLILGWSLSEIGDESRLPGRFGWCGVE